MSACPCGCELHYYHLRFSGSDDALIAARDEYVAKGLAVDPFVAETVEDIGVELEHRAAYRAARPEHAASLDACRARDEQRRKEGR